VVAIRVCVRAMGMIGTLVTNADVPYGHMLPYAAPGSAISMADVISVTPIVI